MSKHKPAAAAKAQDPSSQLDLRPGQSIELLKELHILTRDGKLNQDSRRKLKQVYHLFQFIDKLLKELPVSEQGPTLADHGAGKSYLGFIIYDLFFKGLGSGSIYGIETRSELVASSQALAQRLGFERMKFLNLSVAESAHSDALPDQIDVVTALHACDTATDDALGRAVQWGSSVVLAAPCCGSHASLPLHEVTLGNTGHRGWAQTYPMTRMRRKPHWPHTAMAPSGACGGGGQSGNGGMIGSPSLVFSLIALYPR